MPSPGARTQKKDDMINKTSSYTSANIFPVKLLKSKEIPDRFGKISPIHIQLNPTNVCNLNCSFCSCSNRDKKIELKYEYLQGIMKDAALLGCRAITITGGGEPLLYSKINELIHFLHSLDIQIGLVTNGTMFEKLGFESIQKIRWIRISHTDIRAFDFKYKGYLTKYMFNTEMVDWAFSYVISDKPNLGNIIQVVNYANTKQFTHVRIVSDLLDLKHMPDMDLIKESLNYAGISDDLVIYQGRKEFVKGRKKCLISLLKPVISADAKLYPCCVYKDEIIPVLSNSLIMNKQASKIEIGDLAITPDGIFEIKEKIISEKQTALRITLKNGRSLICSEDHPLFVADNITIKRPYPRKKILSNYTLKIINAIDIKIGDMVPVLYRLPKINNKKIEIAPEFARLLGYYTGDGWCSGTDTGFMFGKKNKHLDDLLYCLDSQGFTYNFYERRTGYQIMAHVKLNKYLKSLGAGDVATEKRVPFIIFNANETIKKEYLKAYIRTDCNIHAPDQKYGGFRLMIATISRCLVSDLFLLLNSLGVEPTLYLSKRAGKGVIENRIVNIKDIYRMRVCGYYNYEKIKECIDVKIYPRSKTSRLALTNPRNDNLMFLPIKNIERIDGGTFYDLKVTGSKFCVGAGSILVHNCGSQYSKDPPPGDYDETMCMGIAVDLYEIYQQQRYFDGSQCDRCYYDDYNSLLNQMIEPVEHEEFL